MDTRVDSWSNNQESRDDMVERQIVARGVRCESVLDAMRAVPREAFLPERMREFAYEDTPLPIAEGQTISQPYIVAFMIEALQLSGGETVLDIGTGSGYAAAILGEIADHVYSIERIKELVQEASDVLDDLGYSNVHVVHADGTLGWQAQAPYDAIAVAAGGPEIPESLKAQLKVGGRLVMPVGDDQRVQELVRVTRVSETEFQTEDLADVRFVPLLGAEGWQPQEDALLAEQFEALSESKTLAAQIAAACEPFEAINRSDLSALLDRIGDARVVLLGEGSHGTSEFYRMRQRITRQLIDLKDFNFVAIEADWPDAARIDHYVRHFNYPPSEWTAFSRFPTWMWRNNQVREFVDWLRNYNGYLAQQERVAFYGLDLYSLYNSIRCVLDYLDAIDPETAEIARQRYGCLEPWESDPASYGKAALSGLYQSCENEVVKVLEDLLRKQHEYVEQHYDKGNERFMDAAQNARLISNAEKYYRVMYYGSRESWNLRDTHMFDTLKAQLDFHGPDSKAIVWAHNSHIGNAAATEMSARGETNIGELCRREFGDQVYSIGFGTHKGTVAAAESWDKPMRFMDVQASRPGSFERLCHDSCHDSGETNFMLPLRHAPASLREALSIPLLERAIGVIYRPDSELASHYFQAVLPQQFDEYIWFNETWAVTPFATTELDIFPDTYPFGL